MRNFLETVKQIKEDLVRGGLMSSLHEMERKARPSSKTIFTVAWLVISVMVGEIIIYNHQNIFSSYVISASDIHSASPDCKFDSGTRGRAGYDDQVTSSENFYKKILVKYASESEQARKSGAAVSAVKLRETPKAALNVPGRAAVISAPAASVRGNENIVIHKVKRGETLAGISKNYFKTTSRYRDIARTNNLKTPYSLKTGDSLIIMLK